MKYIINKINNRNISVEIIRIIACLLVIYYHLRDLPWKLNGSLSEFEVAFECFSGIAVMMFFIISGFYIYNKNGNIFKDWLDILKKFFINIFIPFVMLSIIALIFNDFFTSEKTFIECIKIVDFKNCVRMLIESFTHFSVSYLTPMAAHLWYIYAYLIILIFYPITRFLLTKCNKLLSYILLIIYFIILIVNDYLIINNNESVNTILNVLYRPIFYSAFGYVLYNDIIKELIFDKDSKNIIINKKLFFISLITFITTYATLYKTSIKYYLTINGNYVYASWYSSFIVVMASMFILMIFNINFDYILNDKFKNIIKYISSKTLSIYLIHYFVAMKLNSLQFRNYIIHNRPTFIHQILNYIISILIVFILSFAIIVIIDIFISLFRKITNYNNESVK